MDTGWKWYAGNCEEEFQIGPCDTREDAISEASDDRLGEFEEDGRWKLGIHLIEAKKDPLRLADFIDVEMMLEFADEAVGDSDRASENDDPPYFSFTPDQEKDLTDRIKRACNECQDAHGISPKMWTFSNSRNAEYIVIDHPDGENT